MTICSDILNRAGITQTHDVDTEQDLVTEVDIIPEFRKVSI